MTELIIFAIGVIAGSIVTQILVRRKTSYGHFKIVLNENQDTYELHIRLDHNENLFDKQKIVLNKDFSHQ